MWKTGTPKRDLLPLETLFSALVMFFYKRIFLPTSWMGKIISWWVRSGCGLGKGLWGWAGCDPAVT